MTKFLCNGDWLLEYADGELADSDSAQAESHLAACPACSREVAALKSSREILSAYFATADSLSPVTDLSKRTASQSGWNSAALALASTAAAALLVSMFFFLAGERGEVVRAVTPPAELSVASPVAEEPEEEDVLAMISRETQIARLRMASEILAKEPGMNERHLALEKYLAEAYGVTKQRPFEM
ncbi:MAG: zf-HC2 domain-containing protein [Pirellulaceae bacterium]|nr:zf-HC2 domain-containing protein [Pirellulaceae bacterium]